MSYIIHASEPAAEAVRRIVREQNQRILALLGDWETDPADRIHGTRQTCKRIRALLRLVRPSARYVFQVENRFYRDVQRRVAYARDAAAMVEALDLLRVDVTEPLLLESVAMLRAALAARATHSVENSRLTLAEQIKVACADVADADRRLELLPVDHLRRRDLRKGVRKTFARCAARFESMGAADAESLHSWRKDVKYAYHHTRLLAELLPEWTRECGAGLRELADALGRCNDLALLDNLLRDQPDALGIDTHVQRLRRLTVRSQQRARSHALQLGAALFGAPHDGAGISSPTDLPGAGI